jgi:cytochrome c-type biogenesis protein CcmE
MTEARITPPNRNRRLMWIGILGVMLVAGLFLVFQALNENTQFFENPSDVVADGFESRSEIFKIGGLVKDGTVVTQGLTTRFLIDDFERDMAQDLHVKYTGALPDLFREGQGVVVSGRLTSGTHFQADEVLAKHDENYQPVIDYRDGTPALEK